ncbi:uncharacterized protein DS421_16g566200 [Arachis hypogaea]|nr:uncharacterized protein DS421_16g566200 [Arachis hypogaea]
MAIITTLCSVRFRRKKSIQGISESNWHKSFDECNFSGSNPGSRVGCGVAGLASNVKLHSKKNNKHNNLLEKELPLPPTKLEIKESKSFHMKNAISKKLSFNVSLKLPKSLSIAKNHDDNDNGKKTDDLKKDDAVWMQFHQLDYIQCVL